VPGTCLAPRAGSATFEEAFALVAGDHAVEELLLRAAVVEVVLDDLVAECGRAIVPSSRAEIASGSECGNRSAYDS